MKNHLSAGLIGVLAGLSLANAALASDAQVEAMGDAFVAAIPADWAAARGGWRYFDVNECYQHGDTCFGNNPSSPYGFPVFPGGQSEMDFQLGAGEAVVIFFRTPPEVRYFGFTQYLMTRGGDPAPIFGSLGDTLNEEKLQTLGAGRFNELAVMVWTADLSTYESIRTTLASQGVSKDRVNLIPIPYGLPVYMGNAPTADTFGMLMRTALPSVQADFDRYKNESPFYVLKTGPFRNVPLDPAPIQGYADEISGYSEEASLATALNSLVADIKARYQRNYSLRAQTVSYTQKVGWDCIEGRSTCAGDNHDALYSVDTTRPVTVTHLSDMVIIAGVNHQKTGKALYLNHTVYDTVKMAGIVSVDDRVFTSKSAYYHAGIFQPSDPRRAQYANLYAYVISYNCGNLSYCQAIPAPTPENPVGLEPGAPFFLMGRSYVDPRTGVRPSPQEVVKHQVFVGTRR